MKRILILTCGLALVGAACGGGDDDAASAAPIVVENVEGVGDVEAPSTDTTPTGDGAGDPAVTDDEALALEFAACMRGEGVDMADPVIGADGSINLIAAFQAGSDGPVDQEAAQAGFEVCGEILDGTSLLPTPDDVTQNEDSFLEFAACLREQGLDVDDPDLSELGGGGGPAALFGENFDPQDPANEPAIQACQSILAGAFGG